MDEKVIRDTEALTFTATEAVSNGLADKIGSLDDAIAAFAADLSLNEDDETMTEEEKKAAAQAAEQKTETARTEGHAAGMKDGATAERTRIKAIVESDAGKARPAMAMKMALGDKFAALDSETIVEMLGDMPEEKASAAPSQEANATGKNFQEKMDADGNPDVGTPGDKDNVQKPSRAAAALNATLGPLKKAS